MGILICGVLFCGIMYLGTKLIDPQPIAAVNRGVNSDATQEDTDAPEEPKTENGVQVVSGDIHQGLLILVNNQTKFVEQVGQEKEDVMEHPERSYQVARGGMLMDVTAMDAMNRMVADYESETGDTGVTVISAYRSIESQQEVMDEEVANVGEEEAKRWVTEPGYSEHHTGYAVDFSIYYGEGSNVKFVDSPAADYFLTKGPSYGLIKRYAQEKESITGIGNEPWHFRYLGVVHATAISKTDYCYEEYIDYLKQFTYDGEHLKVSADGKEYEIYYASGSEIQVPENSTYEISGNNVDGLIATVQIS